MTDKLSSFHRVADKSLELISRIAYLSDAIRGILTECDQEAIENIARQVKDLEAKIGSYKNSLLIAVKSIATDDDSEIDAIEDKDGLRL